MSEPRLEATRGRAEDNYKMERNKREKGVGFSLCNPISCFFLVFSPLVNHNFPYINLFLSLKTIFRLLSRMKNEKKGKQDARSDPFSSFVFFPFFDK